MAHHLSFVNKENEGALCISVDMEEDSVGNQSDVVCPQKPSFSTSCSATKYDTEEKLRQLELEVLAPSSHSLLQNKENRNCAGGAEGCYAFTPDTVDGSLQWSCTNRLMSSFIPNHYPLLDMCMFGEGDLKEVQYLYL